MIDRLITNNYLYFCYYLICCIIKLINSSIINLSYVAMYMCVCELRAGKRRGRGSVDAKINIFNFNNKFLYKFYFILHIFK